MGFLIHDKAVAVIRAGLITPHAPTRQVFCFLAHATRDKGEARGDCWPGRDTIARETSLSPRSVDRAMTWLEEQGWVSRLSNGTGEHKRQTIYRLNLPKMFGDEMTRASEAHVDTDESLTSASLTHVEDSTRAIETHVRVLSEVDTRHTVTDTRHTGAANKEEQCFNSEETKATASAVGVSDREESLKPVLVAKPPTSRQLAAARVWKAYPNSAGSKRKALELIEAALRDLEREGVSDSEAEMLRRIECWTRSRAAKQARGEFVPGVPHGTRFFGKEAWWANDDALIASDPAKPAIRHWVNPNRVQGGVNAAS